MGVLDDAIREHLELKRQHGASADEVTKQEQEALGALQGQPVTSEPAADVPEPSIEPAQVGAWGCSSAGRALPSHGRGQGFESPQLHRNGTQKRCGFS